MGFRTWDCPIGEEARRRRMSRILMLRESKQNPAESRKIYFQVQPCNRLLLNSIMKTRKN